MAPATSCENGFARGSLTVNERAAGRERLSAKFIRGPALTQTDFGYPLTVDGTVYDICVYDEGGSLVGEMTVEVEVVLD